MRLSDLVLIFNILVISGTLSWGLKCQLLMKTSYTRFCYNQIVDNAVEDGLLKGTDKDGSLYPVVDEAAAVSEFHKSLLQGFGITQESWEGQRLLACIGCIVILQNQYFCIITGDGMVRYPYQTGFGAWIIDFSMDGVLTCRNIVTNEIRKGSEEEIRHLIGYYSDGNSTINSAWKNEVVTECVQQKVSEVLTMHAGDGASYRVIFPVIEEDHCHTLSGIGMLCFMQYASQTVDGYTCSRFTVSGARVEER